MVSTADDYAPSAQMLLNGGELDNVRLLSPKTVALMTADAIPKKWSLRAVNASVAFDAPVPTEKLSPNVVVMEAAEHWTTIVPV
jgi:hypothetical protein